MFGQAAARERRASIRYLPLDAPPGMSQAVIVQGLPLVHTRQLLPLDVEGKIVGEGSADRQIEQVLHNLRLALRVSGSDMDKLVRVNVYALSTAVVDSFREHLSKLLGPSVRPAITAVLTPLADRKALVAVDAVAVAPGQLEKRSSSIAVRWLAEHEGCADAAVLPARRHRVSFRPAGRRRSWTASAVATVDVRAA